MVLGGLSELLDQFHDTCHVGWGEVSHLRTVVQYSRTETNDQVPRGMQSSRQIRADLDSQRTRTYDGSMYRIATMIRRAWRLTVIAVQVVRWDIVDAIMTDVPKVWLDLRSALSSKPHLKIPPILAFTPICTLCPEHLRLHLHSRL